MRTRRLPALIGLALAASASPGSRALERPRLVASVVAERFSFTPSEIRAPAGAPVELRIRSNDTMHGFRIVGHGIDVAVPKRRQGEAVVVFEPPAPGRYRFECSRVCGAGHGFMRGEIVAFDPEPRSDEHGRER